jgi:signal transduction histidine kinase
LVAIGRAITARNIVVVGTLTTEYRWLLPAALFGDPDAGRAARRSTRDWIVDTVFFLVAFGFALVATIGPFAADATEFGGLTNAPVWLVVVDGVAGLLAAVALWWRRRWPVHILLGTLLCSTFSMSVAVASIIMLFTVAVHRRFAVAAAFAGLSLVTGAIGGLVRPDNSVGFWMSLAWSAVLVTIVILWGMVVRSRRQLVMSLRDRAERAESEQQLRVAQARVLERNRIAREMHDVLAHRISLLSLHAGALEIHPDAAPEEVAGAAGVIRASAHLALQDLREVIGVLREDGSGDGAPERPQPTLSDVSALADESIAAGVRVHLGMGVEPAGVPAVTGRTAYRIVQEGLTNARKHASGVTVGVVVGGKPGQGLTIDIRNPWPVGGGGPGAIPGTIPGTGTGLIGLAERATLAGGRLSHGREGDAFVLSAWLPWPEHEVSA